MATLPKILVAAIALSGVSFAATTEPAPEAALLGRAAARLDLRRKGTLPISLRARVVTTGPDGEQVAGNYHWLWVSPTAWREEIAFPGIWEATGRSDQKTWRKRRLDFTAQEIGWTYEALHFADRLRRESPWSTNPLERTTIHGVAQTCVKNQSDGSSRRWCFDSVAGDLLTEEGADYTGQRIVVTYGDWREAEGKRFPGTIGYTVEKRKRVEVKVTEFDAAHEIDPATFEPPEGAEELATCDSSIRPAAISQALKPLAIRGSAAVEARIASDGKVKRVRIISASSPEFAHKLAEQVAARSFTPATCDGRPVESDQLFRQTVR